MIIIKIEYLIITLFKNIRKKDFILLYKIFVDVNSSTTRKASVFLLKNHLYL